MAEVIDLLHRRLMQETEELVGTVLDVTLSREETVTAITKLEFNESMLSLYEKGLVLIKLTDEGELGYIVNTEGV